MVTTNLTECTHHPKDATITTVFEGGKQIDIKMWSPFQPLLFTSGESWIVVQAPLGDRDAVEQWEQQRPVVTDQSGDF